MSPETFTCYFQHLLEAPAYEVYHKDIYLLMVTSYFPFDFHVC